MTNVVTWRDCLACTSGGNCTALGELGPSNPKILFAVSQKNGVWGSAKAIPGVAALLAQGKNPFGAQINDLACPSAGNCGAGGGYFAPGARDRADRVHVKRQL